MRLALYQPDIAQNVGAALRLAACFGVALDIVEPCGFPLGRKEIRRVAMDYGDTAETVRHADWESFLAHPAVAGARLLLLTTKAARPYTEIAYRPDDVLLLGRESAGVPAHVHARADARLLIPMAAGARSLNVVMAGAVALGEALRQTRGENAGPPA